MRDIVSINDDCWLIATDALPALYEAVEAAAEPCPQPGAFCAIFEDYLDEASEHGKTAKPDTTIDMQ